VLIRMAGDRRDVACRRDLPDKTGTRIRHYKVAAGVEREPVRTDEVRGGAGAVGVVIAVLAGERRARSVRSDLHHVEVVERRDAP